MSILMIINVKVKPNSKESRIVKENNSYIAFLKSPAEDNKANIELTKLIKKKFGNGRIIKGLKSKEKVVLVE